MRNRRQLIFKLHSLPSPLIPGPRLRLLRFSPFDPTESTRALAILRTTSNSASIRSGPSFLPYEISAEQRQHSGNPAVLFGAGYGSLLSCQMRSSAEPEHVRHTLPQILEQFAAIREKETKEADGKVAK